MQDGGDRPAAAQCSTGKDQAKEFGGIVVHSHGRRLIRKWIGPWEMLYSMSISTYLGAQRQKVCPPLQSVAQLLLV